MFVSRRARRASSTFNSLVASVWVQTARAFSRTSIVKRESRIIAIKTVIRGDKWGDTFSDRNIGDRKIAQLPLAPNFFLWDVPVHDLPVTTFFFASVLVLVSTGVGFFAGWFR